MSERSKENREKLVGFYLENPDLLAEVVEKMFQKTYPDNFNNAWIWDGAIRKDFQRILPHLSHVLARLKESQCDGVIRILAKTCELACERDAENNLSEPILDATDKAHIIDACFYWLQENQKIATKVFSMTALWQLRYEEEWLEEAIREELQRQLPKGSSGFRNRALKILQGKWTTSRRSND